MLSFLLRPPVCLKVRKGLKVSAGIAGQDFPVNRTDCSSVAEQRGKKAGAWEFVGSYEMIQLPFFLLLIARHCSRCCRAAGGVLSPARSGVTRSTCAVHL